MKQLQPSCNADIREHSKTTMEKQLGNICAAYNLTIPLLGLYPSEMTTYVYTYVPGQNWKATGEWLTALFILTPQMKTNQISINKWMDKTNCCACNW